MTKIPRLLASALVLALAACNAASPDNTVTPTVATAIVRQAPASSPTSPATAAVLPTAEQANPTNPPPTESPAAATATTAPLPIDSATYVVGIQEYAVPAGSHPHDVAPATDGGVWYTAQHMGALGWLDPATGATRHIPLGSGSAPHGVIVGPDGAAWITDSGLNAIVRVDPQTDEVKVFPLPGGGNANLNTATFDPQGMLWFTGQNGIYGRLDPATGQVEVFDAPHGRGPYGVAATLSGQVFFVSLAGSYLGQIDPASAEATVLEPPTAGQGARRVWADSQGLLWISEWNAGQLGRYDPASGAWQEWRLPGDNPMAYAVYVDLNDQVWLSDFGANALVHFNPATEAFQVHTLPSGGASVRQILGRPGEIWGAESGVDKLVVLRLSR
jgi:virginiamycin B lyase